MKKPKAPCFNCADRFAGCHITCKRYAQFKTEHEKAKEYEQNLTHSYHIIEAIEHKRFYDKRKHFDHRKG